MYGSRLVGAVALIVRKRSLFQWWALRRLGTAAPVKHLVLKPPPPGSLLGPGWGVNTVGKRGGI